MMLGRCFNRTNIDDFFGFGIADPPGRKEEVTEDDKDNSNDGYGSHTRISARVRPNPLIVATYLL